ncbi:MAG: CDP-diacylglycerol--glycerol-3-phosphate 3-phosphatidyltransferase [Planctomycetota bacterium]|nr:MAG: CDP-diacylglycerol--glycerol-3-phosphate 3-phosphatidyltransferase [Planctomycetota bacterium]
MSNSNSFNVPNTLTAIRLVLAIAVFVLMALAQSSSQAAPRYYVAATVLFVLAASTDWIDGFWARRYEQVTVLGRIFDPFVDKVIICGVFISLVAEPASQVKSWMAVVVVARELLVTALRGFIEQRGTDFSASMSGKLKMVVQCVAATASLWSLAAAPKSSWHPGWLGDATFWLIWAAVAITIYSGLEYVIAAARLIGTAAPPED